MTRRNKTNNQNIKDNIVTIAYKMVRKEGCQNLSTRKIAKEAGYSVGNLYNIFQNYDDIIFHINAKTLNDLNNFIRSNLDNNLQQDQYIKNLAKLHLQFAVANQNIFKLLFEYPNSPQNHLQEIIAKENQELLEFFEEGIIRYIHPNLGIYIEKNAKSLWAGIYGICSMIVNQNFTNHYNEEMLDCLVEGFLRGL